jgi:hypothetical protein
MHGQGFFKTFFQAAGRARIQMHQFVMQALQRALGVLVIGHCIGALQLPPNIRFVLLGQMIDDIALLMDLAALDKGCLAGLPAAQIQKLVAHGTLQMSLFDKQDLAEITHPDYPGERLIICRNPLLAAERVRRRQELIEAAEKKLKEIEAATQRKRQPVRGTEKISYLVGKALAASKVEKYFRWNVTDTKLQWQRDTERIQRDAGLDGIYVLRTNVLSERLDRDQTVLAYKRLATVERAFRSLKSVDLNLRPIHHRLPDRVRAHVFIAMLAYYLEWHMRRALAPLLFDDELHGGSRSSVVAPAVRSQKAQAKALRKRTEDDWPVQSFQGWLKDLATIVKNSIQPKLKSLPAFDVITRPTPSQQHALQLLGATL